jgi:hypothetical protein
MMTEIHEVSRVDQLEGNGPAMVVNAMTEYGIDMDSLISEITNRVAQVPAATASESAAWYPMAHNFAVKLAETYGVSVEVAAGVIAAVSPRMPWLRNKSVAESVIRDAAKYAEMDAIDAAKEMNLGLSANIGMAIRIVRAGTVSGILTGIKRQSFYNNIVSPFGIDSVTVDTWMMAAYCEVTGQDKAMALKFIRANEKALSGTGAGYFAIAEAVRVAAKTLGMTANAVQAVYWVSVAGNFNGGRTDIG